VKRIVAVMILSLCLAIAIGFAYGQEKKEEALVRFVLPPPKEVRLNKPVNCTAIASAALYEEARDMEDFKHNKLSAYIKKGTDKLRLWLDNNDLMVQVRDEKPDIYNVSGYRNGFMVAVHYGGSVPALYSISINEKSGFAIWSLIEPMFFPVSEYPFTQAVYMQCNN